MRVILSVCFRSVRSGVSDREPLPWRDESQLHGGEVQHLPASGRDHAPLQNVLHRCHGNRLGLFSEPHLGDRDVPRPRKVTKRARVTLSSFIESINQSINQSVFYCIKLCGRLPLQPCSCLPGPTGWIHWFPIQEGGLPPVHQRQVHQAGGKGT